MASLLALMVLTWALAPAVLATAPLVFAMRFARTMMHYLLCFLAAHLLEDADSCAFLIRQCVELTQRYFYTIYKTTPPDWHCGNAIDLYVSELVFLLLLCGFSMLKSSIVTRCGCHPSGVVITTDPKPGDAVVLNLSQWGHTGIITYDLRLRTCIR